MHASSCQRHIEPWKTVSVSTPARDIEWWYLTACWRRRNLAVVFATKDASRPTALEPLIEIDLDLPDGRRFMKYGRFKAAEFEAIEGWLRRPAREVSLCR